MDRKAVSRWLALGLLFFSLAAHAHRDLDIKRTADGQLLGLPAEYGPARLDVGYTVIGARGKRLTRLVLQLGKHEMTVPTCLLGMIQNDQSEELHVLASWYHDESILPPYIQITLPDPAPSQGSFSLLFNLRTAALISMDVYVPRKDGTQLLPIDVHASCTPDELTPLTR